MGTALAVTVIVTVLFAAAGPWLTGRLPPAAATRLIAPASLVIAATGVWAVVTVAFTWVAGLPGVSHYGQWSPAQLRAEAPFPVAVPICCGLLALAALGHTALVGTRRWRTLRAVRDATRRLGAPGALVVLDTDRPDAFATPGPRGRIVITAGLLRALGPDERRALIAHESSHLTHRHAWWLLAADLAAAANPLLLPTGRAVRHAVERWADEDAAREVTDRRLVARTLARAALLTRAAPAPVPAAAGGDVPRRVRALLDPPPRPRVVPLAVLLALLLTSTLAAMTVQRRGDALLDRATAAAPAARDARTGGR